MIKVNCKQCEKEFKILPYKIKIGKGKYCSRDCQWQSLIGRKLSKETKKKMSEMRIGKHCPHKGHKISEETKKKIGEVSKRRWKEIKQGLKEDNFHTQKWQENVRKSQKKRWDKIGRKKYKRPKHERSQYRRWRIKVFERDNWTCQFCGLRSHIGLGKSVYLEAHHIKSWIDYSRLRYKIDNGITLCRECHNLTRKGRPKNK